MISLIPLCPIAITFVRSGSATRYFIRVVTVRNKRLEDSVTFFAPSVWKPTEAQTAARACASPAATVADNEPWEGSDDVHGVRKRQERFLGVWIQDVGGQKKMCQGIGKNEMPAHPQTNCENEGSHEVTVGPVPHLPFAMLIKFPDTDPATGPTSSTPLASRFPKSLERPMIFRNAGPESSFQKILFRIQHPHEKNICRPNCPDHPCCTIKRWSSITAPIIDESPDTDPSTGSTSSTPSASRSPK